MADASTRLVLASTSPYRAQLLRAAGLSFSTRASDIDERRVSAGLTDARAIAQHLAAAKALAVASLEPGALVIGGDLTLECEGRLFHKPADRAGAARQLQELAGRTHQLHAALAVARDTRVTWQDVVSPRLEMRPLSASEIERYLDLVGDAVFNTVGAYHVEGPGIQLFRRIDGDWSAIQGLPLLPLLAYLREQGVAAWC